MVVVGEEALPLFFTTALIRKTFPVFGTLPPRFRPSTTRSGAGELSVVALATFDTVPVPAELMAEMR